LSPLPFEILSPSDVREITEAPQINTNRI